MKFIHTGDWHIGKLVNEFSMIDDQKYILDKLKELLKKEEIDALIIAGDIYDRSIPPVEAVELFNEFLNYVVIELKIPVLIIAGNHDSAERLDFGSGIFNINGLHMEGTFKKEVKRVILKDEFGNINFYLVPYVHPAVVKKLYGNEEIRNYNDAMKAIVEKIAEDMDKDERNILVTHGYVTMNREKALEVDEEEKYDTAEITLSESERPLSIGGTDLIDGNLFKEFDYVALGHLHGQQRVDEGKIRYSGSLLKYSFSEENHRKGVSLVEINNKGEIDINHIELKAKRDLRTIKGPIDNLIKESYENMEGKEDYIQAILTDDGEIIEPMQKLRAVYPNTMLLRKEVNRGNSEFVTSASNGYKKKGKLDLFKEYYENIISTDFTEAKENVIKDIINEVLKGDEN